MNKKPFGQLATMSIRSFKKRRFMDGDGID